MIDFGQLKYETKCYHCNMTTAHVVDPSFESPAYWEAANDELLYLRSSVLALENEFNQLGKECIDAGFKPSYVKRCEGAINFIKELKKRFRFQ